MRGKLKCCVFLFVILAISAGKAFSSAQQNRIDSLKKVLLTAKEDTTRVNVYNTLAKEYYSATAYDTAIIWADKAFVLSEKINYKKGKATAYNTMGLVQDDKDDYAMALD